MKSLKFFKVALVATLAAISLQAEEIGVECDMKHETCMEKCDSMENPTTECYSTCDEAYNSCLDALGVFDESTYTEESYEEEAPAPIEE